MKNLKTILLSTVSLVFLGCNSTPTDIDSFDHEMHIGVSQCSGGYWRDQQNNELESELLLHEGATIEIRCAEDDCDRQIADIQYYIDNNVDLIIVSPLESAPLTPIISKAYKKGIPVLLFDRFIENDDYTAFVGGDNVGAGEQHAAYAITRFPEGANVVELMGDMSTTPAEKRHEGFIKGIASNPNIHVVASIDCHWQATEAVAAMDSLLSTGTKIDMVVSHTDWMADEARKKADELMPGNKIVFVGTDGFASPDLGIYALMKGQLDATAIYPTGGREIIDVAMKILHGEKVEHITLLPCHLISTPHEAMLIAGLVKEVDSQVSIYQKMRERVNTYFQRQQLENMLFIALALMLLLAIGVALTLYRLMVIKRKANAQLEQQRQELVKQRDDLISMTQQLEEATHAKLLFFTNVSHDFRTPLTLISAPIEAVLQQLKGLEGPTHLLNIAQRNVQVLLRLVNEILDFRKYENGKLSLTLKPTNLAANLRAWSESFQSIANKKNVNIVVNIDGKDEEWNRLCDIEKLERVFYNLMGNSVKFTPDGGQITVSLTADGEKTIIKVGDTGTGISADHLQHIFERFYQVDSSHYEGSGIGLTVVKSFVEIMSGHIDVSSADKSTGCSGTTITITLPLAKTSAETTTSAEYIEPTETYVTLDEISISTPEDIPLPEDESKPVILVIDDNADLRMMLRSILSDQYHVLITDNGKRGLELAKIAVPDIILCDVMMPVMDGIECCHALKNDIRTSHIPVIMLTACSLDEERIQGLEQGAEAYIAKPFSTSVLIAQISTLLKNRVIINNFYSHSSLHAPHSSLPAEQQEKETNIEKLSKYDKEFLEKLRTLVEEHYSEEFFNVEILSEKICLSRAQLYRKCKSLTGDSPVELIRNIRLEHGKHLISSTNLSISEIAKKTGFSDPAYFSRCYKNYYGVAPSRSGAKE